MSLYDYFKVGSQPDSELGNAERKALVQGASNLLTNPAYLKVLNEAHARVFATILQDLDEGNLERAAKDTAALKELTSLHGSFQALADESSYEPEDVSAESPDLLHPEEI
jgi:hypothetical protein